MEFPDVAKIERLSLRPGDRLVLSVDHPLDDVELTELAEGVRGWGLPEGSVIILEAGLSLQVLEAAGVAAT
jgi:hypothetical protein